MSRASTDALRLLAMMAVVVIHATAGAERRLCMDHRWFSVDGFSVLLNQAGRFSVPLFVLLSGYGLARSRFSGKSASVLAFARGRFLRIALPFLVWTPVFWWMNGGRGSWNLAQAYWNGSSDYHFYFFPILLWCYVFFPFLIRIVPQRAESLPRAEWNLKNRIATAVAVALAVCFLAWASPAHLLWERLGVLLPRVPSWSPSLWLIYFFAGILLARRDQEGGAGVPRPWGMFFAWILAFVLLFGEYMHWSARLNEPGYFNHFQRMVVFAFSMATLFLWRSLEPRLITVWRTFGDFISKAAGLSFFVFIFHTWVLRFLEATPLLGFDLPLAAATLGATFLLAWVLDFVLPSGWGRMVLGLPGRGDGMEIVLKK